MPTWNCFNHLSDGEWLTKTTKYDTQRRGRGGQRNRGLRVKCIMECSKNFTTMNREKDWLFVIPVVQNMDETIREPLWIHLWVARIWIRRIHRRPIQRILWRQWASKDIQDYIEISWTQPESRSWHASRSYWRNRSHIWARPMEACFMLANEPWMLWPGFRPHTAEHSKSLQFH